jgi:hypothetical protein
MGAAAGGAAAAGGRGICGIAGGCITGGCNGGGVHAGRAAGAAAAGGAAAACAASRSRNADPEITRVNSPGPVIGGGAGAGGSTAGEPAAGGGNVGAKAGGGAAAADAKLGAGAGAGAIGGGAAGCSDSVRRSCVNPPAAGACAEGGGGGARIGSGALAGSWFKACRSCVNPPCAGGEELAGGAENGKLLDEGSGASDFTGSNGGGAAGALGVENICVNAPGLELGLALRAGSKGAGVGTGDGAGVPGALPPLRLWNILVNSPCPDADAGGGATEGAGAGVHGVGSCAAGFAPAELKMRVNSPGAEFGPALAPEPCEGAAGALEPCAAGALGATLGGAGALEPCAAGALGATLGGAGALEPASGAFPANGAFIDRNIAVKLPGSLPLAPAGGGAGTGGTKGTGSRCFSGTTAGKAGGVCPEAAIFSIGTALNTFASSSDGRGGALAGSVVLSACSMRVNSPGPELPLEADAGAAGAEGKTGAAGAACGNGTGSAEKSEDDGGAAEAAVETGAGGGGAGAGSGFFPSLASRSSSSREDELGTVPKIPVALEAELGGDPPPDSSDWGACSLPKRSQNAFMRVHHLRENIALFRNPRLHRFGLTVKGRQPTIQAHSMAARSGLTARAALKPFACAPDSSPLNDPVFQTVCLL